MVGDIQWGVLLGTATDGEWAAGLTGQTEPAGGARAGAAGGRSAFVPGPGRAAARCGPMWPPRCAARRQAGPEHVQLRQAPGREPQRRGCEPGGEEGP